MVIVFESMPAAGKTTQIALLKRYLEDNGYKVIVSEAGKDSKLASTVKGVALKFPYGSEERSLMFWIMRLIHAFSLNDKLNHSEKDEVILIDRFWGSLIANASLELKYFKKDFWDKLGEELDKHIDVTLLLDVSYENSTKRKYSYTIDQKPKFFKTLKRRYSKLAKKYHWVKINANCDIPTVQGEVKKAIEARLNS